MQALLVGGCWLSGAWLIRAIVVGSAMARTLIHFSARIVMMLGSVIPVALPHTVMHVESANLTCRGEHAVLMPCELAISCQSTLHGWWPCDKFGASSHSLSRATKTLVPVESARVPSEITVAEPLVRERSYTTVTTFDRVPFSFGKKIARGTLANLQASWGHLTCFPIVFLGIPMDS